MIEKTNGSKIDKLVNDCRITCPVVLWPAVAGYSDDCVGILVVEDYSETESNKNMNPIFFSIPEKIGVTNSAYIHVLQVTWRETSLYHSLSQTATCKNQ